MDLTLLSRPAGVSPEPPDAGTVSELCRRLLPEGPAVTSACEIDRDPPNAAFVLACADGTRRLLRISPDHEDPTLFAHEAYLLRRETALGGALAPVLGPLLPAVHAVDFSGCPGSRDAVLGEYSGDEAWETAQAAMSPDENDAVWRELGGLVRRMHEVRGVCFGWPAPEPGSASWSGFILRVARGLLLDFGRLRLADAEAREWLKAIEDGRPLLDEVHEPRLVHGGLTLRNVLVRRVGDRIRITSLLGHGRGLWGDPMSESLFQSTGVAPAFWEACGPRAQGPGAEYRAHVYRGLALAANVLEARRSGREASELRRELARATQEMRRLIVACGLS